MTRRTFIGVTMVGIERLLAGSQSDSMAPALFCGHGSPMNIVTDNAYTRRMKEIGTLLKKPKAVLVISAHWVSDALFVSTAEHPETIYDFYGFPLSLYTIRYPASGVPKTAEKVIQRLQGFGAVADSKRGLDHGAWSVLKLLFPDADIPVFQMSLNRRFTPEQHYALGMELSALRKEGIMILGSGDIVHNLYQIDPDPNAPTAPWAETFEAKIKSALLDNDPATLIRFKELGNDAKLACPSDEHFLPLLYVAAATAHESIDFVYEGFEHGTISLSSFGSNLTKGVL